VIFAADPYSGEAFATVERLRRQLAEAIGDAAIVGGPSAEERDVRAASVRDALVIVPLILIAVLVILALLLRSITAPLLLMGTVVLSFAAAFGVSVLVFDVVFGFPGIDPSLPLLAFLFLVALGVDYNIFLMARVREESEQIGTRRGMLKGLAVTGGVITSAGLVLAGTFAVLGVLPLVALTELGFIVAFGVLLDTFIVRTVLVPALTLDLGRRVWWPSRLSRAGAPAAQPTRAASLSVAGEAD
jgi:putative drug exporter of the RND superfamily